MGTIGTSSAMGFLRPFHSFALRGWPTLLTSIDPRSFGLDVSREDVDVGSSCGPLTPLLVAASMASTFVSLKWALPSPFGLSFWPLTFLSSLPVKGSSQNNQLIPRSAVKPVVGLGSFPPKLIVEMHDYMKDS